MEAKHNSKAISFSLILLVICSFLYSGSHFMIPYARAKQPTRIGNYEIENAFIISEAGRAIKRMENISDIKKIDVINEYIIASTFSKIYGFITEGNIFDWPYRIVDFETRSIDEKCVGSFLFRLLTNRSIQIVNLSNNAEPKVLGNVNFNDQFSKFEVGWKTLFSITTNGHFQIRPSGQWDSTPTASVFLNNDNVTTMVRDGRRMFIGTDGGWLFILSIVSDSNLVLERSVRLPAPIHDLAVYSDLVILGTHSGISVYNTIIDRTFSLDLSHIRSISIQNDLIYAACEEYLMVFKIESNQEISIVTALDFDEQLSTVTVNGLFAYVATKSKFYILQIGEYMNPTMKFKMEGAQYTDTECDDRLLFMTETYFNIYQTDGLSLVRNFNLVPAKTRDIEIEGNLAFLLLDNNTLQIYNISNPGAAWLLASHALPGTNYTHMKVEFDHVFFASEISASYASINDLLILGTPIFVNNTSYIVDIAISAGLFIVASPNAITVWDVNGVSPQFVSNIQVQNVRSIELDYPSLYVGTTNSIKTYDLNNLYNPQLSSDIPVGEITDMEVNRDFLVASDLSNGLCVFNRSNAFNPIYINSTGTQGGISLSLSGELAVITCYSTQNRGVYGFIFMNFGAEILEYLWDDSTGFNWMNILQYGLPILAVVIIVILVIVKIRRNNPKFKKMSSELKRASNQKNVNVSDDFFDSEF